MKKKIYVECGSCGMYHLEDYYGDCRNNKQRFTFDQVFDEEEKGTAEIITLEDQLDKEEQERGIEEGKKQDRLWKQARNQYDQP